MKIWYSNALFYRALRIILTPLSVIYYVVISVRKALYKHKIIKSYRPKAKVLVVGNLSVGGNGKTPMVEYLACNFAKLPSLQNNPQAKLLNIGIISRGYGGDYFNIEDGKFFKLCKKVSQNNKKSVAVIVKDNANPSIFGDEACLLANRLIKYSNILIAISPNRQASIELLDEEFINQSGRGLDLVISDDGLQHYRLERDYEIVVVDGERKFSSGKLLPAGALREPLSRLKDVDLVIYNENKATQTNSFELQGSELVNLLSDKMINVESFSDPVVAMAGIGNPDRFFKSLATKGLILKAGEKFVDHHVFELKDLQNLRKKYPQDLIVMTEKDAIKCKAIADLKDENLWYLPVKAKILSPELEQLVEKIKRDLYE